MTTDRFHTPYPKDVKVFSRVPHAYLLYSLYAYGFLGHLFDVLRSLLTCRSHMRRPHF